MATGCGKTTVMGMVAAWSILNKVNDRSDGRFSDVVLIVCPNVTIRERLAELDPERGEACLYRTRDLVPPHLMPVLTQGRVLVKNWHEFNPREPSVGGTGARVVRAGKPEERRITIKIAQKTTTMRRTKYMTPEALAAQMRAGTIEVVPDSEKRDTAGNLKSVQATVIRHIESDTALVRRVLGKEVGGKQNILVMNDEAHHAYRIRPNQKDEDFPT
jgi:type III restriction enzyme